MLLPPICLGLPRFLTPGTFKGVKAWLCAQFNFLHFEAIQASGGPSPADYEVVSFFAQSSYPLWRETTTREAEG